MRFNEINFRHELEIGITDRSQLGLSSHGLAHRSDKNNKFSYDDGAVGLIYNLSGPVVDLDAAAAEAIAVSLVRFMMFFFLWLMVESSFCA
jgi:hypothetical protein